MSEENYTYILECSDGSFYTGWTTDVARRVREHQAGTGGKYTRAKRPVKLMHYEVFDSKQEAMRREWEIKQLTRKQKEALVQSKKCKAVLKIIDEINQE